MITTLTTLGILEQAPTTAAEAEPTAEPTAETATETTTTATTTTTGSAPREDGELAVVPVAAANGGGGTAATAAAPAFKPKDTASLRAVAVQVRKTIAFLRRVGVRFCYCCIPPGILYLVYLVIFFT